MQALTEKVGAFSRAYRQRTHRIIVVKTFDKYYSICYNVIKGGEDVKSYSSREVIAMLKADGWFLFMVTGSHHHFKHPTKKGKTTVKHPTKDIPPDTLKSIAAQSGLKFK